MGVNTKLAAMQLTLDDLLSRASETLDHFDLFSASFEEYRGNFTSLSTYLQLIMGEMNPDDPRSMLAWLRAISECVCLAAGGAPPTTPGPSGCEQPLQSLPASLVTSTDYPGRVFFQWDCATPQGIDCSSTITPATPGSSEMTVSSTLTYYVWVTSSAGTFSKEPDDPNEYPCNEWVSFFGLPILAISLPLGSNGTAYICLDPATGFVDCVTRGSVPGNAIFTDGTGTEFPGTPAYIPLDSLGVGDSVTSISWGTPVKHFTTTDDWHILAVDAFGWTFQRVDGTAMQLSWIPADLATDQHHTWSTSDTTTYTMPDHTAYIIVDNAVGGPGDGDTPFTAKICPAEPL